MERIAVICNSRKSFDDFKKEFAASILSRQNTNLTPIISMEDVFGRRFNESVLRSYDWNENPNYDSLVRAVESRIMNPRSAKHLNGLQKFIKKLFKL